MRIAVLGVGLIGGSIGLAARKRLDAAVSGHDPDPAILERAVDLGALDEGADSVAAACRDAGLVFCAAPVSALSGLVGEALAATGDGVVVTDVGSTKRQLAAEFAEEPRFVGGHPLAGAETSGVEGARPELFDGARWYLTPGERSEGVLYDALQRAISDFGARPQAIDAESHDRIMATISHLPHVLANVLAAQAAEQLSGSNERMPDVGPSFRDTTRVAGANPSIWGDIFASNSDAVAAEIDGVVERLQDASRLLREGDGEALADWHRGAGERRDELLAGEGAGGVLHELRVRVPNEPGIVAELALALGKAGVNIEDMALYPAADMRSGAISIWVAGEEEAERAAERVRELGHGVGTRRARMSATRFEPSGPLRGELRPPPDKSISHRAALFGAMADAHCRVEGYLDAADTRSTLAAIEALGAEVSIEDESSDRLTLRIEGPGLRAAKPAAIDVGNAGTLLRILPGWLAGQGEGEWTLDGDESIRSRPVDRVAEPLRAMGASVECRDGRLPPLKLEGARLRAIDYELPVASAQVKSCLLLAGLLAEGQTTVREPLHSRDHTERLLAGMGAELHREGDAVSIAPAERLEGVDVQVPGDFSSAAFALCAALLVEGSDLRLTDVGLNGTRIGLLTVLARMGVEMGAAGERNGLALDVDEIHDAGPEPLGSLRARRAPLRGAEVEAADVPSLIDELPLVAHARLLRRGRDGGRGGRRAAAQGIGSDRRRRRRAPGPRRRDRGPPRRLCGSGHGGPARRHARRPGRPPPGDARRGRRARFARGGRGRGFRGRGGQLPGLRARPALADGLVATRSGGRRRATARARAGGGRRTSPSPRGARWDRRRPAAPGRRSPTRRPAR